VKGKEELQVNTHHTCGFIDEYLEKAINTSNIYESTHEADYDHLISKHNVNASIIINNTFYNKCMNLLFSPERYHMYSGWRCGQMCVRQRMVSFISLKFKKANMVGFDHENAIKQNLPIVSGINALDLPNGQSMLLFIHGSIYSETSNHSLLSEFQLREFGMMIDSISHRRGGTQQMIVKGNNGSDALTIPLDLVGCIIHFRHRLPTTDEIATLKQYFQ
jgi:hypothetical protein